MRLELYLFLSNSILVLRILGWIVFAIAVFGFRVQGMSKLTFWERLKTIIPRKSDVAVFGDETKKLRWQQGLWIAFFVLLLIRVVLTEMLKRVAECCLVL